MAQQTRDNQAFTGIRLPENFKPIHYDLFLKPDFDRLTFKGQVKIHYQCARPESKLVLHALELEISDGHAEAPDEKGIYSVVQKVIYSEESETATIQFCRELKTSGTIMLNFTGILNDKMKGFYRTTYSVDGHNVVGATTQFESTDARRCLPCFDEPALKATFSVTMVHPTFISLKSQNDTPIIALSNTPQIENSQDNELTVVKFGKTPIMSTYLLAFVVGAFEYIEGTDGKRPLRVFTTPGKKEQGRYALEVTAKAMNFYENYFGIEYPLEKVDLIAIPDFASGAMENWGLITYRESSLLVDPKNTATTVKQNIALTVTHELAHQWFGNLVTMEWWTHLWLNEGFASFMEYLCTDDIFPEYDIWSQFVSVDYSRAASLDSLHSSHPIEVPINHPSEIDEIFDSISYSKGATIIRMLYNYIGDELFRVGMKNYLTKFSYKNAATEDLWRSLEDASGKPICKLMSCWTAQKGFPWISVKSTVDGNDVKLMLTQSQFTADGVLLPEEEKAQWMIPVAVISANDTKSVKMNLFEKKTAEILVQGAGSGWVKLNPGTVGLYRTAYPEDMSQKLWPAILDQSLPAMDRLGIQSDFFALCQAGSMQTVQLLKLLEAFKTETNFTVWASIDACISKLSVILSNTDCHDSFKLFCRNLYSEIFKKLTWSPQPEESHTDAMARALVINRLIVSGDSQVIEDAVRRYKNHMTKNEIIPADLRFSVYRAVSCCKDESLFESLFNLYNSTDMHEEKNRAAKALGCTEGESRLKRVVDFALSDRVRNQDLVFFIAPMGVKNPNITWELLQNKKDMLRERYGKTHLLTYIISSSIEAFTEESKLQEIEKFFNENKFPGAERTVQQSMETIRLNIDWLARDKDAIKDYLS